MLCFARNTAFFYYDRGMTKGEEKLTFSRRVLSQGGVTGWAAAVSERQACGERPPKPTLFAKTRTGWRLSRSNLSEVPSLDWLELKVA